MKKITNLFFTDKISKSTGKSRKVAVIVLGADVAFINADILSTKTGLNINNLTMLVGSSLDVTYFVDGEVMVKADADTKTVEVLCEGNNKIIKNFTIEYSIQLTVAKMILQKAA